MRIKKLLNRRNSIGIWFVGSLFVTMVLLLSVFIRTEIQNVSLNSYQLTLVVIVCGNMLASIIGVWNVNTLIDIAKKDRKRQFILPRIDENKVA